MVQIDSNRHALKQQRRQERQQAQTTQAEEQLKHHRMRRVKKYTLLGIIAIVIVSFLVFLISSNQAKAGPYDSFAQCLTEKGVVMYGAYWCPHCANQKKLFGRSFKYVTYVECASDGKDAQPELCLQKGVESYPTWEINDKVQSGEMPLQTLAEKSGCPLTHPAPAQQE